ncbi:Uncharacterised protein [Mycobacteroides abscessus subsp. abscessus]|nr:Uncharacterised protein [Mycobacteroides abscessus subsp. abscessus]
MTIWPSPDSIRCGRNALVPCATPQKLMFINQSKSSHSMSLTSAESATPALLNTRLTCPNSFLTSAAWA